jgi:hypothetical protein
MRRWILMLALCVTGACGDDGATPPADASRPADASAPDTDASAPDAGAAGSCLDRPTDLARPPTGQLPCELFPPKE